MENEKRNKTLSIVLIALGIMMSIGGLIGLIGGFANMWNLHELDAKDWLFGTIICFSLAIWSHPLAEMSRCLEA